MSGANGLDSASSIAEGWFVSVFTMDRGAVILPPLPIGGNGESGGSAMREASGSLINGHSSRGVGYAARDRDRGKRFWAVGVVVYPFGIL